MINFSSIFLVAVALSMDALSVSISIGINSNELNKKIIFTLLVGVFHFIFPWLGMTLGKTTLDSFILNGEKILGIILILLAIEMIYEQFHHDSKHHFSFINIIIMSFSVSIDSFMTGIGLYSLKTNIIKILTTFSLSSIAFTIVGILLGKWINNYTGKYSEILGILILVILGVKYCLF